MKDEALDNDCTSAAPINVYRTEPRPPEILGPAKHIERVVDALGDKEHVIAGVDCDFGTFATVGII